jgi:hypothetical protein
MQYCYDFTRIEMCENNMDVFISLFNIIKQLSYALQVNGSNYSSIGMTIDPKREAIDRDEAWRALDSCIICVLCITYGIGLWSWKYKYYEKKCSCL